VIDMPEPGVVDTDLWSDLQPLLDQELSRLPDKYRVAVILCDLEGKTRREVASQLQIPEGTLSSRLTTARTMLAKRLARYGLAVSGGTLAGALGQNAGAECVPPSVVSSTIKAATLVAVGQATSAGVIPAKVAALTGGVLKLMLLSKLRTKLVLLGMLAIVTVGLVFSAYHGFAQQPANENRKEPTQSATPPPTITPADNPVDQKLEAHYCWLVFGAKGKVRALVRLAGEEVSIDRDGDGKFGKGERFKSEKDCKDIEIADPDGKTTYVITWVHVLHTTPAEKFLGVRVHIRGPLAYHQEGIVEMASDRTAARQANFHGPLTIAPKTWTIENRVSRLTESELLRSALPQTLMQLAGKTLYSEPTLPRSLKRTGEPSDLFAALVTEGQRSFVAVVSPDKEGDTSPFRNTARAFVDVEFPATKPGDPPIKKRSGLDHSRAGMFRGSLEVPDQAGVGNAKVTFSFAGWKGVEVAPTTVEIPLQKPK
jgi:hypothetical protein